MYMDGMKLFAKNEKELETLKKTVRIYCQDIGINFGIEKMHHKKWETTDGIELPNQEKIRTFGEKEPTNNWEYWKWISSNKR